MAVAVALIPVLTGCGGGDETALTKQEYLRRGEAICERLIDKQQRQMVAFYKAHGFNINKTTRPDREVANVAVVLPIAEEKIAKLAALPAPEGDEAKVKAIFVAWKRAIRKTEEDPVTLALPGPHHPFSFEEAADMAAAYGLNTCVQP